jgi:AraC-like DNA-binding protein
VVPGGLPGGKLRRVADHIDANLGRELRLGELSGVVHMSPFHFARLFKRTSGVPPHRFVVRRRIGRAIELLAGGEHPIGEIARLVGFATPSHFTTVFRRITGVTPTEYRRGRGERTGRIPTEGAMRPPEVVTQLRHHHVGPPTSASAAPVSPAAQTLHQHLVRAGQGDALTRMKEEFATAVPLGRMGDPDEIAKAVSFLASDEASYVSGIELFVDGGVAQI